MRQAKALAAVSLTAMTMAIAACDGARDDRASTARAPQSSPTEPRPSQTPPPQAGAPSATPGATAKPGDPSPGSTASTAGTASDSQLEGKVKAAVAAESGPAATQVSVTASGGVVTLKGSVPKEQIDRVVQAARSVDGVRDVVNELKPAG